MLVFRLTLARLARKKREREASSGLKLAEASDSL
jgi:hypothetical protein